MSDVEQSDIIEEYGEITTEDQADNMEESEKKDAKEGEPEVKLLKLPMSRIKKIIKLDPDVTLVSPEAVFLITKATELMIDSLAREAYWYTAQDKKKTVLRKHLDSAINYIDALAFLEGALD